TYASGGVQVGGEKSAAGFERGDDRSAAADGVKVVDPERDPRLASHGQQMKHGVGRASGGGDTGDGVFERRASENARGAYVAAQQIHYQPSAGESDLVFSGIDSRDSGSPHRRKADEFKRGGHGVGGELASARPGPRAGHVLQFLEVILGHSPC